MLRSRVRDGRTHVVLTSRMITVESIDDRLLRSVTDPTTHLIKGMKAHEYQPYPGAALRPARNPPGPPRAASALIGS